MKNFLIAAAVLIVLVTAALITIRTVATLLGLSEWTVGYFDGMAVMALILTVGRAFIKP